MIRLLERNIASIERRLVLVAPPQREIPEHFRQVTYNHDRRERLVEQVQQLRGSVYLEDGAIGRQQLTPDGLHRTPEDARCWHLLMLNRQREVSSCAWYLEHDDVDNFEQLRVRHCPLAREGAWRDKLWSAVQSELERARRECLRYAEGHANPLPPPSIHRVDGIGHIRVHLLRKEDDAK